MTHTNHHSHNTCSYDVLTKRPEETVLSGYTGKREEEAASRVKRCPFVEVFRRFLGSRPARQAGRALDTDRVQSGQREESMPNGGSAIPPVGKREELRTWTASGAASGKRPAGNGGFLDLSFSLEFASSVVLGFGYF